MTVRLQTVATAMRAFAEHTASPRQLLDTIARQASEALGAFCGFIELGTGDLVFEPAAMYDPDPEWMRTAQAVTLSAPQPVGGDGVFARALATGEPVVLTSNDATLRKRFPRDEEYTLACTLEIRQILFVPLRTEGTTTGALSLMRHGPAAPVFTDADIQLARTLADHAALALANARLLERVRCELAERERVQHKLETLTELNRELTAATSDHQKLIDLFARRMGEHLGEMCMVRFLSEDGRHLARVGAIYHPDPTIAASITKVFLDVPLPVGAEGTSITGMVAATGKAVLIPVADPVSAAKAVPPEHRATVEQLNVRSILVAPLKVGGKMLGVASLTRSAPDRPYTEADLRLFTDAADHVALAITNARLLRAADLERAHSERLAGRMRMLSELAQEFAGMTDSPRVLLRQVAKRISEVVGDGCSIRLLTEDEEHLEPLGTVFDPDPERIAHLIDAAPRVPTPLGGIPGKVIATCQTMAIPVLTPEELPGLDPVFWRVMAAMGIHSLIYAPLRSQGRALGTVAVYRASGATFTEDDVRFVEDITAHAALAVTNSRLLFESKLELAERMRTEAVLRRGFLEAAPDAILIVNAEGVIQLVNSQTEVLFGYPRGELVGKSVDLLVPARDRGHHPDRRAQFMVAPTTRPVAVGRDLFARRKDGTEFVVEISLSPIDTPEGQLVAASVRDVTERRRELEERNLRMQEANRLKSEFLANMSHELRTPLNAVIGFAALMHGGKAGPLSEVHREYIGDILQSSRHLLQLINDVLDLSKVESGRTEVHVDTVTLAKVVAEVRDILRGLAHERRIQIATELDPTVPTVRVDPRMFKQVLYNYLSNAIKFTPDGGRVSVHIRAQGDSEFRVDVVDTGIGIQAADLRRLFVEFQQLDQGASKRYPGTGLGLALTKRIVEAQGGYVAVESTPGTGSTFTAVLPRDVQVSDGE